MHIHSQGKCLDSKHFPKHFAVPLLGTWGYESSPSCLFEILSQTGLSLAHVADWPTWCLYVIWHQWINISQSAPSVPNGINHGRSQELTPTPPQKWNNNNEIIGYLGYHWGGSRQQELEGIYLNTIVFTGWGKSTIVFRTSMCLGFIHKKCHVIRNETHPKHI